MVGNAATIQSLGRRKDRRERPTLKDGNERSAARRILLVTLAGLVIAGLFLWSQKEDEFA
jgi:hypothetical protein